MFVRRLFAPEAGEGGGAAAPAPVASSQSTNATTTSTADPVEGFKAALRKHDNDAASLARTLHADAEVLRRENAELRGKLPREGSTLLDGDDAAAWKELTALGKPAEIKAKLLAGDAAAKEVSRFERKSLLTSAAAVYGWNPTVLERLAAGDLEIEVKEAERNGKLVPVATVLLHETNDKGEAVVVKKSLEKHAEKEWVEFLPALKAHAANSRPAGTPSNARTVVQGGRRPAGFAPSAAHGVGQTETNAGRKRLAF